MASPSTSAAQQLPDDDASVSGVGQLTSADTHQGAERVVPDAGAEHKNAGRLRQAQSAQLSSTDVDEEAQSWLKAQCDMIAGTKLGIMLDSNDQGDEILLARWPHNCTTVPKSLIDAAHSALREQTFVIVCDEQDTAAGSDSEPKTCFVATPLQSSDPAGPVAAFELPNSIRHQQQAIVQLLQWGGVWFGLLRRKHRSGESKSRLATVIELLSSGLEHSEFNAAATTVVTQMATHLACTRVSLGLLQGSSVSVRAISNSARVDTRLNLTRDIGAAMNEAVDQDATLTWPLKADGLPHVTFAQELLARQRGRASVLSTPLYDGTIAIGALTLERDDDEGFDQDCRDICETLAVLLGPVMVLKHEKGQSITFKVLASLREGVTRLFGSRHVALKLYAFLLICAVIFLSTATGDYRITAQARLEGSVKRVITAPRDGFVASAAHRAGDIVEAGELLARLDDRELLLEQLKLNSQGEQLDKEHRAAMTSHDRSATAIVNSRKQQTAAQLALVEEHLLRTHLIAPFAGIVVSGDLSQSIGSPVENGQVLFEIAPLDDYRVVLEVDERDIGDISVAQRGSLTLTGIPDTAHSFSVNRIVPLSTPHKGRNVFEVQAILDTPTELIRPGMEGIGKVEVDRRKLIWVWTHELIDWLRLTLWTWIS